jgi:hypothetical protein
MQSGHLSRVKEVNMNNQDISLGEFVKQLTLRFTKENMVMPLRDERPWHMLFYDLKASSESGKPDFLSELLFDWDGPYPRSPELAEYLDTLHWTGCLSASNPQYEKVTVNPKVSQLWSALSIDPDLNAFIDHAVQTAKGRFNAMLSVDAPSLSHAV